MPDHTLHIAEILDEGGALKYLSGVCRDLVQELSALGHRLAESAR
jgi:hypothetical protein